MPTLDSIINKYNQWMSIDINDESRSYIQSLFNEQNWSVLDELLNKRILFGTAGLRASMEPGFSKMNDITVLQASQGLAQYLLDLNMKGTVVIGHDHRFNSKRFADLTAAVFLIKGFQVEYIGPDLCATPLVPFAVDQYGAKAGIMITASHNPKSDNGYKVYWENGCQIIPPHDSLIQQSILRNLEPLDEIKKDNWETVSIFKTYNRNMRYCKDEILSLYVEHLKLKLFKCLEIKGFNAVYTAMHGVGTEFVDLVMDEVNCKVLTNLKIQCEPDPKFSTVSFPNPEENGALDLALSYADSLNIDLVVANDPDADRFSFAFKYQDKWKQFTGNEIGILFADYVISNYIGDLKDVWLINSTVSSQMLETMATVEGFNFTDTLTGFKWIGNKAIELEKKGFVVPFAYEEAIGFMFESVHDKDGIATLLMFLQMYQWHMNTLATNPVLRLEYLYSKYGYFKEFNGYFITTSVDKIFNENIRSQGLPKKIGDWNVLSWRDLTIGYDSTTQDKKPLLHVDPNSQMITAVISKSDETQVRFTLRGSGTEPKLKIYIEAKGVNEQDADEAAVDVWDLLRTEFKLEQ